jgi:hypothetical protein
VILWGQCEEDNRNATSQSAYTASLNNIIAFSNTTAAALGWTSGTWGRWLVAKQTLDCTFPGCITSSDPLSINGAIQAAQAAVVNGTQVFAGANADALQGNVCGASANAACRQSDRIHWTDNGSYSYAVDPTNGWQQALHASGGPF